MIDVIPEPVASPVPTGFAGAKKSIRNTPPLVRQMMSEDELSANEVIVVDLRSRDTVVGGPTSTTPTIAGPLTLLEMSPLVGCTRPTLLKSSPPVWRHRLTLLKSSPSVWHHRPTLLEMLPPVWRPRPTVLKSSPPVWIHQPTLMVMSPPV